MGDDERDRCVAAEERKCGGYCGTYRRGGRRCDHGEYGTFGNCGEYPLQDYIQLSLLTTTIMDTYNLRSAP